MIDSQPNHKKLSAEDSTKTLLEKYQTIISELMLCAKTDSNLTLREFLEKLELD